MQIADLFTQMGGYQSMARELGVTEGEQGADGLDGAMGQWGAADSPPCSTSTATAMRSTTSCASRAAACADYGRDCLASQRRPRNATARSSASATAIIA